MTTTRGASLCNYSAYPSNKENRLTSQLVLGCLSKLLVYIYQCRDKLSFVALRAYVYNFYFGGGKFSKDNHI